MIYSFWFLLLLSFTHCWWGSICKKSYCCSHEDYADERASHYSASATATNLSNWHVSLQEIICLLCIVLCRTLKLRVSSSCGLNSYFESEMPKDGAERKKGRIISSYYPGAHDSRFYGVTFIPIKGGCGGSMDITWAIHWHWHRADSKIESRWNCWFGSQQEGLLRKQQSLSF